MGEIKKPLFKSNYIKPFLKLDKDEGKIYLGFEMQQYLYLQPEKKNTNEQIANSIRAQFDILANDYVIEFSRFMKEIWSQKSGLPKLEIIDDNLCTVRAINGGLKVSSTKQSN